MKSLGEDEMKHRLRWVWGRSLAAAPRHPPRGESNSLEARASCWHQHVPVHSTLFTCMHFARTTLPLPIPAAPRIEAALAAS